MANHTYGGPRAAGGANGGEHPTADGRTLSDLRAGDQLGGVHVRATRRIAYRHPYTVDILPASATGNYVAAGVLVGSTLFPAGVDP